MGPKTKTELKTLDISEAKNLAKKAAELELSDDETKQTKKEYYLQVAQELEVSHVPKEQISVLAKKLIESAMVEIVKAKNPDVFIPPEEIKINARWFYEVMSENGYVNPSQQRHKSDEGGASENSSVFTREVPASSPESIRRNELLRLFHDMAEYALMSADEILKDADEVPLDDDKVKLVPRPWTKVLDDMELDDEEGPFQFSRDLFYNMAPDWKRRLDARQILLPQMRPSVLAICFFATNTDFADNFFVTAKQDTKITPKKLAQYLKDSNSFSDLCKLAMDDAFRMTFLEMKCPDCQHMALKVKLYKNGSWDLVCKNSDYHKNDVEREKTPEDKELVRSNLEVIQAGMENTRYIRHYHPALLQYRLLCLRDNIGGAAYRYLVKRFPEVLKKVRNEPDEDVIARLKATGELPTLDEARSTHEPT